MLYQCNTRPVVLFRTLILTVVSFVCFSSLSGSTLMGQGKLSRARAQVRQPAPQPPTPKSPPRERESRDDDHHEERKLPRSTRKPPRSNRNHRNDSRGCRDSRAGGFVYISQSTQFVEPVVVPVVAHPVAPAPILPTRPAEVVIIEEPAPIMQQPVVQTPVVQTPVVQTPVVQTPVVQQPVVVDEQVYQPVVESVPVSNVANVVDEYIGHDWFEGASRLWATVGSDFDGISSGALGLHLQDPDSLGFDFSVATLRESGMSFRDHLWIGDANIGLAMLKTENLRGRLGIGVNWLADRYGADAGFNLTAGIEARLAPRMAFNAEADLGNLGDADFFHGRVMVSRRFEMTELMLGADHYNIGGVEINNFFTGLQLRF